jgi:hypothetical protein
MNARAPLTPSQYDISLNSSDALICRIYKPKIPFRRGDRTNPSTVSLECIGNDHPRRVQEDEINEQETAIILRVKMVRRKTAGPLEPLPGATPCVRQACLADPERIDNQENASQRHRFMIGTEFPSHTRPHGFRVPRRYPNAH